MQNVDVVRSTLENEWLWLTTYFYFSLATFTGLLKLKSSGWKVRPGLSSDLRIWTALMLRKGPDLRCVFFCFWLLRLFVLSNAKKTLYFLMGYHEIKRRSTLKSTRSFMTLQRFVPISWGIGNTEGSYCGRVSWYIALWWVLFFCLFWTG